MTTHQIENQIKQQKESLEKKVKREELLTPVHLQNAFNKENIETQHKYNLEIFEKQAALTREIQIEQSKLLKNLSWRAVIATILSVVIGAILGMYLVPTQTQQPSQQVPNKELESTEKRNNRVDQVLDEKETKQAIKPKEQAESSPEKKESSPKNVSYDPPK
jgi:hypothetical protein